MKFAAEGCFWPKARVECRPLWRPLSGNGVEPTWAQRLKRVFNIDIEVCSLCGGSVRVTACIEDQDVIDRILTHLRHKERETLTRPLLAPPTRAPPGTR